MREKEFDEIKKKWIQESTEVLNDDNLSAKQQADKLASLQKKYKEIIKE